VYLSPKPQTWQPPLKALAGNHARSASVIGPRSALEFVAPGRFNRAAYNADFGQDMFDAQPGSLRPFDDLVEPIHVRLVDNHIDLFSHVSPFYLWAQSPYRIT
jgi:hypothetical protein